MHWAYKTAHIQSRSACGWLIGSLVKRVRCKPQSAPSVAPPSSNGPCRVVIYIVRWMWGLTPRICAHPFGRSVLQKGDIFYLKHLTATLRIFWKESAKLHTKHTTGRNSQEMTAILLLRGKSAAFFCVWPWLLRFLSHKQEVLHKKKEKTPVKHTSAGHQNQEPHHN